MYIKFNFLRCSKCLYSFLIMLLYCHYLLPWTLGFAAAAEGLSVEAYFGRKCEINSIVRRSSQKSPVSFLCCSKSMTLTEVILEVSVTKQGLSK